MEKKTKIGVAGLGARGYEMLDSIFLQHEQVEVAAVCDVYSDRCEQAAELVEKRTGKRPLAATEYRRILEMPEVEAVCLCTSWENHINFCIEAMEAGKYVACEVGGAYSLGECRKLVETYEKTRVPVMIMENCLYGRNEMMLLNMVRQGVLGTVVHCEGGYRHDLRDEIAFGKENRHYRLRNYIHRNTENYPTHELGPIARILGINRGNRMLSLTSVASGARGLEDYIRRNKPEDEELAKVRFCQGDVVNTIITCANGETILLTLDTTLPRYYSRGLVIQGTRGMYCEENGSLFIDGEEHAKDHFNWRKHWGNVEEYREKYDHPVWKSYLQEGVKKGHGGMDWLVFCDFVKSVRERTQTPVDVYDMASWMCISALAEESISRGGMPVAIPDFTNGKWMSRVTFHD